MYEGKKLSDKCQIYGEKDRKKNFGGGGEQKIWELNW